jgi:hypothetical protein
MDGAYLIDGDTSWYRWDAVPDDQRLSGLSSGAYEGRTVWPPLKVIGSDRPWRECG